MSGGELKNDAIQTLHVVNTLLPIATNVLAVIGGVPVSVTTGLRTAQALLPLAESLILTIGTKDVSIDISNITTADQVREILESGPDFPVLSFTPSQRIDVELPRGIKGLTGLPE